MDDETLMEPEEPESPERRAGVWRILGGVLLGVVLLALGAIGGVVALRSGWLPLASIGATTPQGAAPVSGRADPTPATRPAVTLPGPAPAAPAASPSGDVEVVLSADALGRAGIQTARVEAVDGRTIVQVPGSVMPNAYREVKVTPIAGGIVTRVPVELGATVRRGTPLATLSSTDLAEAQTRYLSMVAMLEADQKKLERTRKLAEIGAASRQELEEVTAVHTSRATELEAARQRLLLLGLTRDQAAALVSPTQVVSEIVVPAPIDGVVTARMANLGQVVGMGQELFVVTDLAEVWVVGDLYEQDFGSVAVGAEAVVTVPAYPGLTLRGRVTYIDPRVEAATRTAKVRVEVPNPDGRLRLGMYVSLVFTTRTGERTVVVPRAAVQALGDRHVVYVPAKDDEGKFIQRSVKLGPPTADGYAVLSGLQPGEVVVTEGSFFLRAEAVRNSPS
jgi:cobalt-zinc-cadmium efflux system membrane fusion protein